MFGDGQGKYLTRRNIFGNKKPGITTFAGGYARFGFICFLEEQQQRNGDIDDGCNGDGDKGAFG